MKHESIPVYVLNGFLGSGKTTVLVNVLTHCKETGLKAGVILNELGETNVEGHLLQADRMVELLNGCICCTIQKDLRATLDNFLVCQAQDQVDLLIIEGTGVANPLELIEALTEPAYVDKFSLQSVIGMVDASQYLEYQSIFSSSKEVRKLLQDQIQYSNLLLLNKTDLIKEAKLEKIEKQIRKTVSAEVPIVRTSFAKVEMKELLQKRFFTYSAETKAHQCKHDHEHDENCHHHHHSNHATIKAIKLDQLPKFNRVALEKWLQSLPKGVIRSKGIIQLEETPGYFDFQYASRQLTLTRLTEVSTVLPSIVIIGIDFNEGEIMKSFTAEFLETSG